MGDTTLIIKSTTLIPFALSDVASASILSHITVYLALYSPSNTDSGIVNTFIVPGFGSASVVVDVPV